MKQFFLYTKFKSVIQSVWLLIKVALRPDWVRSIPYDEEKVAPPPTQEESSIIIPSGSNNTEEMRYFEEITRLQQQIVMLEKQLSNQTVVNETLESLKQLAEKGKTKAPGRPPKPHVRILLNLPKEWSILYELGVQTQVIKCDRTSFINTAVQRYIETEYPQLYAVYLRSINPSE